MNISELKSILNENNTDYKVIQNNIGNNDYYSFYFNNYKYIISSIGEDIVRASRSKFYTNITRYVKPDNLHKYLTTKK